MGECVCVYACVCVCENKEHCEQCVLFSLNRSIGIDCHRGIIKTHWASIKLQGTNNDRL
jgi:hypothetical protein